MTEIKNKDALYLRVLNAFAFLAMVSINILAEVLPINGQTTAEISNQYNSLFTPAGITFSIWGVIYAMLFYFAIWQAFFAKAEAIEDIGMLFVASCTLNILWILTWHYNLLFVSTIIILGLLFTLYMLDGAVSKDNRMVRISFSVYLAWITIASIASIFIVIGKIISSFAFSVASQILLCIALVIGLGLTYYRLNEKNDPAYALTMIWSITGIFIKQISPSGFNGNYMATCIASFLAVFLIILMLVFKYRYRKPMVEKMI